MSLNREKQQVDSIGNLFERRKTMSVNQVFINGEEILSTRGNTVTEDTLVQGEIAQDKTGKDITGKLDPVSHEELNELKEQVDALDEEVYKLSDDEGEISESDYIPFNDVSDGNEPKKKTLFTSFVEKVKTLIGKFYNLSGNASSYDDIIPADADLNDYCHYDKSGTWYCSQENAETLSNCPVDHAFKLSVDTLGANATRQTITIVDGWDDRTGEHNVYTRIFNQGLQTSWWTDWEIVSYKNESFTYDKAVMLHSTDDLDNLGVTQVGTYYWIDAEGYIPVNAPESAKGFMYHLYLGRDNGHPLYRQLVFNPSNDKIFERTYNGTTWGAWKDLTVGGGGDSKPHTYEMGTAIPANSDLDDYKTEGVYFVADTGTAETIDNIPVAGAGKLIVMDRDTGARIFQIYIASKDNIYIRDMNNDSVFSAWKNISRSHSFELGEMIPSSSDLNSYNTEGVYYIQLDSTASTISNVPVAKAGKLIVAKTTSANTYLIQTFCANASTDVYKRYYNPNGSVWSAWIQLGLRNEELTVKYAKEITSGDLNTYTTYGVYYWSSASSANISNVPRTSAGVMYVYDKWINGQYYHQIVFDRDGNMIFSRSAFISSSTTWSAWKQLATTDVSVLWEQNNILGAKNLFNYSHSLGNSDVGLTTTYNNNGSVTISGTTTGEYLYPNNKFYYDLSPNTYIFSVGTSHASMRLQVYYKATSDAGWTNLVNKANVSEIVFTLPNTYYCAWIRISIATGVTLSSPLTIYPMLRLASITDNTFEPYAETNQELTDSLQSEQHYLSQVSPTRRIQANEDLNDYTASGTYQCANANIATTLSNCPVNQSFKLVVDRAYTRSESEITQRITCQNIAGSTDWVRTRQYGATSWGAWKHVSFKNDELTVDEAVEITSGNLNTYVTYGMYYWSLSSASSISNVPATESCLMYVYKMWSSNYVRQIVLSRESNRVYMRNSSDNGSTWSDWRKIPYANEISPYNIGLGYAIATVSGSAITATISGFQLRAGVIVALKFTTDVTTDCTLNISNTGAKSVKYWNDEAVSVGKRIGFAVFTFIYDGTYYRVLGHERTPLVGVQSYVADTSGNMHFEWGYGVNRAQIKHNLASDKLLWNYYKNSAWRGDVYIADYDDIVHQTLGTSIPNNANLNTYTTKGIYNIYTNAKALTISNRPCDRAGKLVVEAVAGANYICQIYNTYDNTIQAFDGVHRRTTYDGGTNWTPWMQFAMINGNNKYLYLENTTTTADDKDTGISMGITDTTTGKRYNRAVIRAFQDHQADPYGLNMVIESGGSLFLGGGEAGITHYNAKSKPLTGEDIYLTADGAISLQANANTIANRIGFRLDTSGNLLPCKADALTNNQGSLGSSSNKLADVQTNKLNGQAIENVIVAKTSVITPTTLDDIPVNTAGWVTLSASLSPVGTQLGFMYSCYKEGGGNRKAIHLMRVAFDKKTENCWMNGYDGSTWTGWIPLSNQKKTYVGTCTTNADQQIKVVTVDSDFALIKGVRIAVKFTNTNTFSSSTSSPIQLNVNSTGAKNIWYNTTHSGAGNTGTYTSIYGVANRYITYYYDGTYWVWDNMCAELNDNNRKSFYGTCSTAGDVSAKVVSISDTNGWELRAGTVIGVKFTNTNTASNVTFNVNNSGAKSIYYNNAVYTGNANSVCGYANRTTFYMYNGSQWVFLSQGVTNSDTHTSAYCSTAGNTSAKVASCSGYALTSKSHLHIIMTNANTVKGAITLNVNGRGAKPIYINGSASSSSNYTLPAGSYLIYYNGTNYYFRTDGKITCAGTVTV